MSVAGQRGRGCVPADRPGVVTGIGLTDGRPTVVVAVNDAGRRSSGAVVLVAFVLASRDPAT
ncbi:MAG TPA: hypothetical protein VMA72_20865 [Streptosporangiaceae bacterium]|nr:hypothetical protein [Streptosporangiaceae bacterium]